MSEQDSLVLQEAFSVSYTYTRSTGPIIGDFLTALRDDKKILGIKGSDGRVIVPPMEFDPKTAEPLTELVEVGQEGEVVSFCWVKDPIKAHPVDKPFAYAMIKLDGADVPMVHYVEANSESDIAVGSRVKARWADERTGYITDIAGFELV